MTPDAVRVTTLPSGLVVVTERMDRVETVSLGAYVASGTRNEDAAQNGVSHFLEHMAFKGTEKRNAADIAEAVENVGGHINAYTAREQTAYYVKLLKEDLALGADIIGDILTHSIFAPDEVERERGVILQEIGQANDTPDDIIFDHFQEAAYPAQPMGRPVLGHRGHHPQYPRPGYRGLHAQPLRGEKCRRRRHRQPGTRPRRRSRRPAFRRSAHRHAARRRPPAATMAASSAKTRDLDQVHIVLGFPGVGYRDPDYYPVLLLSTLLGGGMSSRLFQEIREKRGLVYSIYSFAAPYMDSGLFGIYAGTGEDEAAELVPVTLEELHRVQRDANETELRRARTQTKASLLMSLESTGSRCEQLARQLQVFGRIIPTAETIAKIDAVTVEDVRRAAARIFRGKPTLAAMGPAERVPGLPQIVERLAA